MELMTSTVYTLIKKRKSLLISFVLLFAVPLFSIAQRTVEVCKTCELNTVQKGVDAAQNGDNLFIKKGVYQEYEIKIPKTLKIRGEKGTVIDGQLKGEVIRIEADDFIIEDLEIINVGKGSLQDFAAIKVVSSENFLIQNVIVNNPFFGIYIQKSNNGIIRNNIITGNATSEFGSANGIHLWYSHNILIENNEVSGVRDGYFMEFSNFNRTENNKSIRNVRYGLHFMFCNNNTVKHNLFRTNGAGIAIMFSKDMTATHNLFEDNWGGTAYGMLLKEVFDAELTNNTFKSNTTGINVEGSNRIKYKNNSFISNGWAINSRGANYENIFLNNNFLSNSFDLAYRGPINKNLFEGNYWSEYKGYDLDKDGVGDIPYRPVKLFSHIVQKSPEAIILLRSMFVDIVDFAEKVSPVFTPDNLLDEKPKMKIIPHDRYQ